ncbi:MAG: rhodanese-like domain-containing protein [Pyrinomonadaceae bacterium]
MHRRLICSGVIIFAAVVFGCNSAENKAKELAQKAEKKTGDQQAPTTYADGARRVTIAELQTLLKEGKVAVIDVRNQASYDQGHIPGARLIPAGEILNHVDELPKNKTIVTYCS